MVPLVLDVSTLKKESYSIDDDGVLRLIYNFLEENREMARLRRKQTKFFEAYQVESVCTPKGVLGIQVDESDEADPAQLVDVMKQTLIDVYDETHGLEAPDWKQMEAIVEAQSKEGNEGHDSNDSAGAVVNFQRKIIPLDALNLAMESQREIKLRNAAGQRKQQLIVCASLIDKVPNLAGLARTAEIFAADRLVIPDKSVCNMDNFQSISVGAGDWIEIEEVRPEVCLFAVVFVCIESAE
jgi:tRNA guanosine-2'-O-methyltransferase